MTLSAVASHNYTHFNLYLKLHQPNRVSLLKMTLFPLFGYIKSFYKQSKTVFFTLFLIRAIRCNFPKTKEADIKKD